MHVMIGSLDQFVSQLVLGKGQMFQRMRDLGFLLPDIVAIVVSLFEFKKLNHNSGMFSLLCEREPQIMLIVVVLCSLLVKYI